jgi:hypothetical protein
MLLLLLFGGEQLQPPPRPREKKAIVRLVCLGRSLYKQWSWLENDERLRPIP